MPGSGLAPFIHSELLSVAREDAQYRAGSSHSAFVTTNLRRALGCMETLMHHLSHRLALFFSAQHLSDGQSQGLALIPLSVLTSLLKIWSPLKM